MKRAWALGTTGIAQQDLYCVCAITEDGRVEYAVKKVRRGSEIPPGQLLQLGEGEGCCVATMDCDMPGLLAVSERVARKWTLVTIVEADRPIGWHSPELFDGCICWYSDGRGPASPACTIQAYNRLEPQWTLVAKLDFPLVQVKKNDEPYFRPEDRKAHGSWTVQYTGALEPPRSLPRDSLVALFISPDQYHRREAFLKIGSVLREGARNA